MDWFFYSLLATVAVGGSMALYKMPSFKGYSSLHSTFWTNTFCLGLVLVAFGLFAQGQNLFEVSFYGLLWGILFALTMAQQKVLLRRMETNTLLPVTSSLGNVATVFFGIAFFSEHVSPMQWVATAVILSSVFLYSRKKGDLILDAHSVSLGLGIIVVSTLSKVVQKFGATHDSILHFAVYEYIGASIFALLLIYIFEKETLPSLWKIQYTWRISLLCGVLLAIAGFAFLKALSIGPLSGVYPIAAGYLFITALLGVWLYKEKLTIRKLVLMIFTFIGIILMKLG